MRHLVYIICRYWFRIVIVTLLAGAAGFGCGAWVGPRFTATGRLMVTGGDHGQAARNEAEILRDPALIRSMLPVVPQGQRASLEQISHALRVQAIPDTDVVELQFSWRDPVFAAAVLNAFLGEQRRLASGGAAASEQLALAQSRVHDAQAALDAADARLAALPHVAGSAPDQGSIEREKDRISSRLATARTDAETVRLERDVAAKKLEAADKAHEAGGWVDNPDTPASASGAPALDQTFVELLERRAKLLATLPPTSPQVHGVDVQIALARDHAYQTVRQVLGDRLHALDDRLAALAASMGADEAQLRGLDDRLVEVEAIAGSRKEAEARLAQAQRRLDDLKRQTEIASRDAAGLRVLSQASAPSAADFPPPAIILWACVLFGFLLGLASALLAERASATVDSAEDIARLLKIPVLASVPELR